jgi:hypothetical protein
MKPYLRRRQDLLDKVLSMFHKKHLFMVISHFIIPYQDHGPVNRFQEEDSRDLILVSMTKMSLLRKILRTFKKLIMFQTKLQLMGTKELTTPFQQVGLVNRFQAELLRDLILVLMMKLSLLRRDHSLDKVVNTSHKKLPSMEINHSTTPSQDPGPVNKFQEEDSRDQIQVLTMRLSLLRRNNLVSMFHRKLPSMVISHSTTPCQVDGLANRFQAEDLRDLIPVSTTRMFLAGRNLSLLRDLSMSHKKHLSMVISHFTTQYQDHGPVSKSQEEDLKDQTLVSMMNLSLAKRDLSLLKDLNTFHKKLQSTVTNHFTIPSQDPGQVNKSQAEDSKDQTQVSMMKLY